MRTPNSIFENKNEYEDAKKTSTGKKILSASIALVLALILWFYAVDDDSIDYKKTFSSVNVEFIGTSQLSANSNLSVISGSNTVTNITIIGNRSKVNSVGIEDIRATVDVSSIKAPGEYQLPISVLLPENVALDHSNPGNVTVYIDTTSSIEMEISVNPTYTKSDPDIFWDTTVSPSTVKISGPATELKKIAGARIDLDLGVISNDVSARKEIVFYSENGEALTNNPYVSSNVSEALVNVSVYKYKTLPIRVTLQHNLFDYDSYSFICSPASVEVKGSPKIVDELKYIELNPLDEYKIDDANTSFSGLKLSLPDGVDVVDGTTTVNVSATLKNSSVLSFSVPLSPGKNVTIKNSDGKNVTLKTKSLAVKIRGIGKDFNKITVDDIKFTIDLKGVESGSSAVAAEINVDTSKLSETKAYVVGSYNKTVDITVQ